MCSCSSNSVGAYVRMHKDTKMCVYYLYCELVSPLNVWNKCVFCDSLHMCECLWPPVLQHIWPRLQSPSVLSMSSISGPCQTNGSWRLSPGHVPRPLPGPPWFMEPLFLASSEALLSVNGSPLRPRLHSLKTVALGSPRALGSRAKPAAADKPGATSHCPFALLSSAFPCAALCLRWRPTAPLCGHWALVCWQDSVSVLVFTPAVFIYFFLCSLFFELKQHRLSLFQVLKGNHMKLHLNLVCVFQWLWYKPRLCR